MFRTDDWRNRYFEAYDAAFAQWPVRWETMDVKTSHGRTHVTVAGDADRPPLLLLPGGGSTASIWQPIIDQLTTRYRCYALDTVGDLGRSEARALGSRAAAARWLSEVVTGLGFDRLPVMGLSHGAFLALNFAHLAPERVERVVLLAPAATVGPLSVRFAFSMLGLMLCPGRPRRLAVNILGRGQSQPLPDVLVEQSVTGLKGMALTMNPGLLPPEEFSDDELRAVEPPALLIVGDNDWTTPDPRAGTERFTRLVPNAQAELLENCGHVVFVDYPDRGGRRVFEFLDD